MPGLIGKKIGMTTIFSESGKNIPCTVLEVGPCRVTQIKTEEVDGYNAIQLGFAEQKENRIGKAALGHFKKANSAPLRKLIEFNADFDEVALGDTLNVEIFEEGDYVSVARVFILVFLNLFCGNLNQRRKIGDMNLHI